MFACPFHACRVALEAEEGLRVGPSKLCPVLTVVWRICVASTTTLLYIAPLRRSKRGALWTCSSSRMRRMYIHKLALKIHHRVSATVSDKRHRTITDLCSCTCSATTRSGKWSNDSAHWTSVVWLECSGRSDGRACVSSCARLSRSCQIKR